LAKHLLLKLRALEISITVYIGLTSILIILFNKHLNGEWSHLVVRLFVLLVIAAFIAIKKEYYKDRWLQFIRLFSPLLVLGYFYSETDYLNNLFFTENLDPIFVNLEYRLFGVQWSEKFSQLVPSNFFAELMYLGYFSYYLLIIGLPLLIYFKLGSKTAEKVIFIIINSFLIYYLYFIIFPVVGPQFYFQQSAQTLPQGYIFGWLIRTIQHYGEAATAAFPSSHVSICLMLLLVCIKYLKKMLFVVLPIAILLIFSTVYIKAHYAIDVLAAFILTPIIYTVSNKLYCYLTLMPTQHDCIDT